MKAGLFILFNFFLGVAYAQEKCASFQYTEKIITENPLVAARILAIEQSIKQNKHTDGVQARLDGTIVKIPVVVHILYHTQEEKISDAQVNSQIDALNKYFRRKNNDTANTPAYFRQLAADCEIEFQLATTTANNQPTSGITRTYTPITKWQSDDNVKLTAQMGHDAWDAKSYLNIWVCNLDKLAGYASSPGSELNKDGIVMSYKAFGTTGTVQSGYAQGKIAVHEVGHWLGLKHTWGDTYCGDDGVEDTPKQANYTLGCPSSVRITCGNGPYGDMYMNYMDITNEDCINMFTKGQKTKMRALLDAGGARNSLLGSKAFNLPKVELITLPGDDPKWLEAKLFPNPAVNSINLDLSYDQRWIGKNIFITNLSGQSIENVAITSKIVTINLTNYKPGMYFLAAKKDDGVSIKMKFIKM